MLPAPTPAPSPASPASICRSSRASATSTCSTAAIRPPALRQAPLTVDPCGVWFRPEGRTFICGRSPTPAQEPADRDLDAIDHAFFDDEIWPQLAARVPAFEAVKVVGAWAGFYDYNTLDQNGIIGAHPGIANLYFANGFSGHGLQQAPAVGRAIAELIIAGRYLTLDLTRLGYERIARAPPACRAERDLRAGIAAEE